MVVKNLYSTGSRASILKYKKFEKDEASDVNVSPCYWISYKLETFLLSILFKVAAGKVRSLPIE
jgi:hypothetical protein